MARPAVRQHISAEEYLALERQAETKSEYINGEIYAMAGASREHNYIAGDLFGELRSQLRGRNCKLFMSDMRVRVRPTGLYTYPDVVVVCGRPRFDDSQVDVLLNPTVIFEVLSPSTEAYDRGAKFAHYRYLNSLKEYILVAQDRMQVDHFARVGHQWLLTAYSRPEEILQLPALECAIPLAEIYDQVELPEEGIDVNVE